MEKAQLVKAYKSQSLGNKKVYIATSVEPSVEVTGGLTGATDFDTEKLEILCHNIEAYTKKCGTLSHRELIVFIKQDGTLPSDQ